MSFDAEKEISKLWKALHIAQSEIGKTYFRWRKVALDFASNNYTSLEVGMQAADFFGRDVARSLLPRLNWLNGEDGFLFNLARSLANIWNIDGGLAYVENGKHPGEVYIRCTRDPWPTWAKEYDVPMEELVLCREKFFCSILDDVGVFFNIILKIDVEKAIPRGQGVWLIRLYKG